MLSLTAPACTASLIALLNPLAPVLSPFLHAISHFHLRQPRTTLRHAAAQMTPNKLVTADFIRWQRRSYLLIACALTHSTVPSFRLYHDRRTVSAVIAWI